MAWPGGSLLSFLLVVAAGSEDVRGGKLGEGGSGDRRATVHVLLH
jgi:hypothetical protein